MTQHVKIIGSGVSGLTVAVLLLEDGFDVEILTKKFPNDTTSAKAAAIWFPYEVNPKDKAETWSKQSYFKFLELCETPNSGVSIVDLTVLIEKPEDAWWLKALPDDKIRKAIPEELPKGFPLGYIMQVPLIETQLYLDFLLSRFKALKGTLTKRSITNLQELEDSNTLLVNCAGLGSRALVNDVGLYPIHGQIIKAEPQSETPCIVADFGFETTKDRLAYVVPRKDCIILGGTAIKDYEDLNPNAEFTEGIIRRCHLVAPNLKPINIQSVEVGLRPGRSEIRLERIGNLIHNYGHGGGGFTVSWGCAMEVKKLIRELLKKLKTKV